MAADLIHGCFNGRKVADPTNGCSNGRKAQTGRLRTRVAAPFRGGAIKDWH